MYISPWFWFRTSKNGPKASGNPGLPLKSRSGNCRLNWPEGTVKARDRVDQQRRDRQHQVSVPRGHHHRSEWSCQPAASRRRQETSGGRIATPLPKRGRALAASGLSARNGLFPMSLSGVTGSRLAYHIRQDFQAKKVEHIKATALRGPCDGGGAVGLFQLGANPRYHKYAGACRNARPESNV